MPLITDPDSLSQGAATAVADLRFSGAAGATINLDSALSNLPTVLNGDFVEVRSAIDTVNNGLYQVNDGTPTALQITVDKISGANPVNSAVDNTAASVLGNTTTGKNVHFDTQAREIYLLEKSGLDAAGVTMQALYSFSKEEYKDDNFLNQFPFWLFSIDADAGKYLLGTDGANNNGWVFKDVVSPVIRTRKLLRGAGWSELDSAGVLLKQYAGIQTLGTFEDPVNDNAYYQFGTDTQVDDTVNFDFNGPVDEAILCFDEQAQPGSLAIAATTITRVGGSFITEGYKVGGSVTIRSAEDAGNNGTHVLTAVSALVLTTTGLTVNAADTTAILAVDNRSSFSTKLRVRDGDPNGKTFGSSNLSGAGETALSNRLFKFPLSNVTDLKISETDVNIDANAPYTGMSITLFATPQAKAGLVGGSFNFGIRLEANGGTAIQLYEFVQRQLRKNSDIDADLNAANFGREIDDLLVFEGDTLIAGKSIPTNPDGGGSGVAIDNINSVDQNNVRMFDNLGNQKQFPETVAVTLDFNQALIDDTVAKYTLFFDRTIRNTVSDLVINSAGTFTSAGANLPATLDGGVNSYVRVAGLTGGDATMNGIYQVTALTSTSSWNVTRYDGVTMATTTVASLSVDEHPIDSPDAIIVNDNVPTAITGLATADVSKSFDFDGNVQGGRTVSTTTFVKARAIGLSTAQMVESAVQSIATGTPLTIVLTASTERNYANAA